MQWKIDQLHVKDPVEKMLAAPNCLQKATVDPAVPTFDILVNSTVTVYPLM